MPATAMSLSPNRSAAGSLLCGEDAGEVVSFDADASISDHTSSSSYPTIFSPPSDETTIAGLIDAETHHMPNPDYLQRCRDRFIDVTARLDAINWILKVHAFYQFQPVTAFLSINYFDRFLSCSALPRSSGWAFQLLSVACLSLAAKMEEAQVPLLLDLQLFEPRFVFEAKTVQRMELWVLANLKWRLRSVTPFDYLHCFVAELCSSSSTVQSQSLNRFISTASDIILRTTRVIDFLGFAPSTVAAAALLCSAGHDHDHDIVSGNSQLQLCFPDRINKETVRSCRQLMEEYVVDTCPASRHKARRAEPAPPSSPVGVLDAATCGSCDTRSEKNYPGPSGNQAQAEAQAEPPNKRRRSSAPDVQQQ